jgi:hypothetical protein
MSSSASPVSPPNRRPNHIAQDEFRDVWAAACQIVCQGEYALAYCKPLAETKGGEDFIERKSVFEQFPRYQKETWGSAKSGTTELLRATEELMKAIQDFLGN